MKRTSMTPQFVEFIPSSLEEGVLYISRKYATAAHKCCCGCNTKIVTPLKPTDWTLTETSEGVTLHPSIGNWNHPCQSHYFIRRNQVVWAKKMARQDIQHGRALNQAAKDVYYGERRPIAGSGEVRTGQPSMANPLAEGRLARFMRWLLS